MFRDINQSSTMARSAYPDGNGELTDFSLFATKYDAGKPSIATDGLPSELSYQVRTAIRRAVDELGINVPEAAVVLKYPIHFYYSDASAELTGVLALPGAVAILALDGFVPKEQLAAPVIGDISRLREVADELRRRGGLEPLPVRETIYTHTVPEGTFVANQRPAAHRATGRKKGTAMDQEKYDNEVSIKFPAKWCSVTNAQGEDIVIENGTKTETWPAVLCTIPTGTDMNGIDISGYKFKTFRKPWTESDIANGKGTTVTVKKDMPVHLFKYDENDQLKTLDEVIAVMGDDATREIAEHKRFRERAVRELMVPVLPEWESIYNVRTGETFILDSNCEGKLYGFYCTETPLATLVDEGEDGIPYDAALYARRQELHRPQGTHRPARRVPPAQLGSRRGRHDGVRISQTRGARGRHRRARLDRAPE